MENKNQVISVLSEFMGQGRNLVIPRILIECIGDIEGALFLSQLIYWTKRSKNDGWVYKTYKEWEEEISLSKYQVMKYADMLRGLGLLETTIKQVNGSPTLHYRLDLNNVYNWIVKNLTLESENFDNGKLKNLTMESENFQLSNNNTEITNIDYIHEKEIYNKERKKGENSDMAVNNSDNHDNNITDCLKSFTEAIKPVDDSNIAKGIEICLKSQNYPITNENKNIEAKDVNCYNSQNNVKNGKNEDNNTVKGDYNSKNCIKIEKNEKTTEKKRFIKPTVEEIKAYCLERKNNINPEQFYDFYESKGWKIGKNPMKDWKAAVRTWERNRQTGFNVSRKTNALQPKSDAEMQVLIDKYKDFC